MTPHPSAGPPVGTGAGRPSSRIDVTRPHPGRRYDYWLGGKDNFAADRESGDAIAAAFPGIRTAVVENRRFLRRAVEFLARAGVTEFLDIGTGIPTSPNTHEIAQRINPASRVVYVDNDPIVLAHARALLTSGPHGATAYLDADLRRPDQILGHPDLHTTLDLTQPVAVLLVAILHFLTDQDHPYRIVAHLMGAMPPDSYLVISHATEDFMPPSTARALRTVVAQEPFQARTRDQVTGFFHGLNVIRPGVVPSNAWRPDDDAPQRRIPAEAAAYAGVARLPAPAQSPRPQ